MSILSFENPLSKYKSSYVKQGMYDYPFGKICLQATMYDYNMRVSHDHRVWFNHLGQGQIAKNQDVPGRFVMIGTNV